MIRRNKWDGYFSNGEGLSIAIQSHIKLIFSEREVIVSINDPDSTSADFNRIERKSELESLSLGDEE